MLGRLESVRQLSGYLVKQLPLLYIKDEIQDAAGPLQVCVGNKSSCEAAVHDMRQVYEAEVTDSTLLVDTSNAFNSLIESTNSQP